MQSHEQRGENYNEETTGVTAAEAALNLRKGLDFEGQPSVNPEDPTE